MNEPVYEQLTWFQEDFPASLFPWLESKKVRTTTVICGRKCSELSESLRRVGSLVRTYLESCELRDKTLSRTWSVRAMTSSCLILKLRLSVRGTGGNGSHLWATPNTMDYFPNRSVDSILKMQEKARKGRSRPSNLREQVQPDVMKLWPTPTTGAGLCGGTGNYQRLLELRKQGVITEKERKAMAHRNGQLNPDWVEWLMGFPIGWTSLPESQE